MLTEEEGEQEREPEQALIGANSENKFKARDVLGKLLGGMEKIAGDLAYEYIRSSAKFQQFQLTGLVLDYSEDQCEVYELTMDFEENSSILHSGQQKLCVSDAANRLISKLESAQKKININHDVDDLLLKLIIVLNYAAISYTADILFIFIT